MSTFSKIILSIFIVLVTFSISATYYKYFVIQDFEVEFEVDCDSSTESCFTWICDPEIDGEDYCSGDPEEDIWDYKLFYRNAGNVPQCDPEEDDGCAFYECQEWEEDCYELTCTQELAEDLGYDECTYFPEEDNDEAIIFQDEFDEASENYLDNTTATTTNGEDEVLEQ